MLLGCSKTDDQQAPQNQGVPMPGDSLSAEELNQLRHELKSITDNEILEKMKEGAYWVASFDDDWPYYGKISKEQLAKGGLRYHGPNDKVVCAFCTTYIEGWDPDDDPDEEHKRLCAVACPFLMDRVSCGNVPIEKRNENTSGSGNSKPTFSADAYGRVDPTERMLTFGKLAGGQS